MSLSRAKYDWFRFSTSGGFEVDVTLTPPIGTALSVKALAYKHHTSVNTDGLQINSKNAHVSFIESYLTSLNYTVRNANKEVALRGHRVSFADSSGVVKNYIIKETLPDESTGVILCILGDYGS